mmetsp:Transcript_12019/g.13260  ORF Transcript_12019/g.13260 Transcript_12019/m.13260 type:complete len:163 (+) Transcript_12019:79-567(+)
MSFEEFGVCWFSRGIIADICRILIIIKDIQCTVNTVMNFNGLDTLPNKLKALVIATIDMNIELKVIRFVLFFISSTLHVGLRTLLRFHSTNNPLNSRKSPEAKSAMYKNEIALTFANVRLTPNDQRYPFATSINIKILITTVLVIKHFLIQGADVSCLSLCQ